MSFVVNPVAETRRSESGLVTLASLEGRLPSRNDGRPRRNKVIPHNIRKRFMEVIDDNGKSILVYITEQGTVRRDVEKVQDELERAGEYRGMNDTWDVDIKDMMAAESSTSVGKKRPRSSSEDNDDDQFNSNDEDESADDLDSDDANAVIDDVESSDGDFEPSEESESEDDESLEATDEDDQESSASDE
jgi:hypothetical protein